MTYGLDVKPGAVDGVVLVAIALARSMSGETIQSTEGNEKCSPVTRLPPATDTAG